MTSRITKIRLSAFQEQSGCCYYCDSQMWLRNNEEFATKNRITLKAAKKLQCTAEHLIARSEGGSDCKSNIVAACHFCNQKRHKRKNPLPPEKFREHIQKRLVKGKWHGLGNVVRLQAQPHLE